MDRTPNNPGGPFMFRKGERVWYLRTGAPVKIIDRTIEEALGKTYHIRYQNGRSGGFVPEETLEKL